jgi:hypothetical protein
MAVFEETGAYLRGHPNLTRGLHSNEYIQCATVLQPGYLAERLGLGVPPVTLPALA